MGCWSSTLRITDTMGSTMVTGLIGSFSERSTGSEGGSSNTELALELAKRCSLSTEPPADLVGVCETESLDGVVSETEGRGWFRSEGESMCGEDAWEVREAREWRLFGVPRFRLFLRPMTLRRL